MGVKVLRVAKDVLPGLLLGGLGEVNGQKIARVVEGLPETFTVEDCGYVVGSDTFWFQVWSPSFPEVLLGDPLPDLDGVTVRAVEVFTEPIREKWSPGREFL